MRRKLFTLVISAVVFLMDPILAAPPKSFHMLVEYNNCNSAKLNDKAYLEKIFVDSAKKGRFTVLKSVFHQFEPQGVTGILLLAESHISIHTWPEDGYAAVDLFTCSAHSPEKVELMLQKALECKVAEKALMKRRKNITMEYHQKKGVKQEKKLFK